MDRHAVIVGGGPGGLLLGVFLARSGLEVTVLEKERTFASYGEGFTAPALRVLREAGLADRVLALHHNKIERWEFYSEGKYASSLDPGRIFQDYPFIFLIPVGDVLDLILAAARDIPEFELRMGASVTGLIEDDGAVVGVRYQDEEGPHQLVTGVVIGADGRASSVRHLAQIPFGPDEPAEVYDAVGLRVPAPDAWPECVGRTYIGGGVVVSWCTDRDGRALITAAALRGILPNDADPAGLREALASRLPVQPAAYLRAQALDAGSLSRFEVRPGRVTHRSRRGLLLLGDAAQTLAPLGFSGFPTALRDAVVAANQIVSAFRGPGLSHGVLAAIDAERAGEASEIEKEQEKAVEAALRPTSSSKFFLRYGGMRAALRTLLGYYEALGTEVRLDVEA